MPSSAMRNVAVARVVERVPGLRRVPLTEVVLAVELAILAKHHYERLTPKERRRIVIILRETGWHPGHLSSAQRSELGELIAKAEPRLFALGAAQMLSPLSVKRRR